jgi:hypothetical protein
MCQAFAGESAYMFARDKWIRRKGYDAQRAGVPREDNPELDHPNPEYSNKRQWDLGWQTAASGDKPW